MLNFDGFDELQAELDRVEAGLQKQVTRAVVEAMAEVVEDRAIDLCPEGDPAHNPDAVPLKETIKTEVRDYGDKQLALIGPEYVKGRKGDAHHGHLVEDGHDVVRDGKVVGRAEPNPFMRRAFDETQGQQKAAAVDKGKQMVDLLTQGT